MEIFADFIESGDVLLNKTEVLSFEDNSEEYYLVGYKFLEELYDGMAKLSIKYFDQVRAGELPYQFRERQLDSIILPALSKMCNGAVLAEMPVERKFVHQGKSEKSSGRIDYWCIYGGFSFVIEVKHSKDAFTNSGVTPDVIIRRWKTMTKYQLRTISSELKSYLEPTKGVIRLGIQFITSESTKSYSESLFKEYRAELPEILKRICDDVSSRRSDVSKPNYAGYWIPPLRMRKGIEGYETHNIPGLLMMAKIYKPILHKGANR